MNNTPNRLPKTSPNTTQVQVSWFKTGYCTHPEAITLRGGQWKTIQFPSLFALIQHPVMGNILYDTGYSERFFEETAQFPNKLYALLTPVFFQPEDSAAHQLQQVGISSDAIHYVIISHFHADHIGGLADFPNATFICASAAYDAVKEKKGLRALKAGFLPGLLPPDFEARVQFVDTQPSVSAFPGLFETGFDLAGDGSLIAVELPGHATGQLGLVFTDTAGQLYFLIADACWSSRAYEELVAPNAIAQLIFSNPSEYRNTLKKLHQLHQQRPDIRIIPTHCSDIWSENL